MRLNLTKVQTLNARKRYCRWPSVREGYKIRRVAVQERGKGCRGQESGDLPTDAIYGGKLELVLLARNGLKITPESVLLVGSVCIGLTIPISSCNGTCSKVQ